MEQGTKKTTFFACRCLVSISAAGQDDGYPQRSDRGGTNRRATIRGRVQRTYHNTELFAQESMGRADNFHLGMVRSGSGLLEAHAY